METNSSNDVIKAIAFLFSVIAIAFLALITLIPFYYCAFFLIFAYLIQRFYLIDKLISKGFPEKYAMDFFIWSPILVVFLFYLINVIPFRETSTYQIKIEKYEYFSSITLNRRYGGTSQKDLMIFGKFGELDREIKLTMSSDFTYYKNENIDYPYIEFESYKGIFGYYIVIPKTKKIYNF